MHYDFDSWVPRVGTQSLKWSQLTTEDPIASETNITLAIAEMDFACSEAIISAIQSRSAQGIMGYTLSNDPLYLNAISEWLQKRYGIPALAEHIIYCRGANLALDLAVKCFTNLGDGVIIQPPVFQNFAGVVRKNGRSLVENHLLVDDAGNYQMNLEQLQRLAVMPENKLLLLCSPNNPTGTLWDEETLRKMAQICLKYGVKIISDEVHQEIVRASSEFHSLAALCPESDEIITLISLSKGFNLAGLQSSHLIVPKEEDRHLLQAQLGRSGPSPLEIAATIAAYTKSEQWLLEVNTYIDANVEFFVDYMTEHLPGIPFTYPQATYMVWMDLRSLGLEPEALMTFLREKAHLNLNNGASYGEAGKGFVRFNLATPRFVLVEALQRLKMALGE